MVTWTQTQTERLKELEASQNDLARSFPDTLQRNQHFQKLETWLIENARQCLQVYRKHYRRPSLYRLQNLLANCLVDANFVQVATPTIMARGHLERMGIDENHPLFPQIFWLEKSKCLRPMLAPHLYFVLKDLLRIWEHPVRIFEVGSCFRRESKGSQHTTEFTMLNIVEMGMPLNSRHQRLQTMVNMVMAQAGITDFCLESTSSEVYGDTIDVLGGGENGIELGSAAMGPHPLDDAWRIHTNWVGVGFGLERLLMFANGGRSLARLGRSLYYLNGISLSI